VVVGGDARQADEPADVDELDAVVGVTGERGIRCREAAAQGGNGEARVEVAAVAAGAGDAGAGATVLDLDPAALVAGDANVLERANPAITLEDYGARDAVHRAAAGARADADAGALAAGGCGVAEAAAGDLQRTHRLRACVGAVGHVHAVAGEVVVGIVVVGGRARQADQARNVDQLNAVVVVAGVDAIRIAE